jgi:hypothetical protein
MILVCQTGTGLFFPIPDIGICPEHRELKMNMDF